VVIWLNLLQSTGRHDTTHFLIVLFTVCLMAAVVSVLSVS